MVSLLDCARAQSLSPECSPVLSTALMTSGLQSPPGIQAWVLSLTTVDSTRLSDPSLRTLGYTESIITHMAAGHRPQGPFHQPRDQGCDRSVRVPSEPPSEQGCKRKLSQQPLRLALEYPETTNICPESVDMSLASSIPTRTNVTTGLWSSLGWQAESTGSHTLCVLLHRQGPEQTILTGGGGGHI